MTRSAGLAALIVLLAIAGAIWWAGTGPLPAPRNVLLITIDTLRADRVGAYGSGKDLTPTLDALAADGARFARAYTTVPLTTPAHASILNGRYPITHGLRNNGTHVLSEEEILVPEILKGRGFRTAGVVSALVLASSFGLNQGFDLYYEEGITGEGPRKSLWSDHRPGDKTVDRALQWLQAEGDRPFFLWVHLFDPHSPYEPPSPFKERYAQTPYDGEVAFADAQVGRLVDRIREMGLYDDTLIVVLADHGEGLGDHGEIFHAIFLYNTTMHVPLIVRVPGGPRGVVVEDLASTLDIAPTILDALRIKLPPEAPPMQGVSLIGAATRGERIPARSLYLETVYPSTSYGWADGYAIIEPSWKLIDLPTPELYDLRRDAAEERNVHLEEPARAADTFRNYEELRAQLEQSARQAETAAIDDETRDRLLSLGYIGGQQSTSDGREGADPKEMAFMVTPMNIASALLAEQKLEEAETIYRKVLEVDPENRLALIHIGRALAGREKLDEAIPFFERALETYPGVEEFYRTYGWALLGARRIDEAAAVFERALEELPESGHMHFMLGYCHFLRQDWDQAAPELDLAVRLSPSFGKPHYLLAICRLQAGDRAGALASIEQYLRRDADVDSLFLDPYLEPLRGSPEFQTLVRKYL